MPPARTTRRTTTAGTSRPTSRITTSPSRSPSRPTSPRRATQPSPLSDASLSDRSLSDDDSLPFATPPRALSDAGSPPPALPIIVTNDDDDDDSPLSTPPLGCSAPDRVLLVLGAQRGNLADPEDGGMPGSRALRLALSNVLAAARSAQPPPLIVHVRHCGEAGDPDERGQPGWHLWTDVRPGERVLDKRTSSAFAGTKLGDWISTRAELVVVGCSSDFDVSATCRDALRRKNMVLLIRGAHGSHHRPAHLGGGVLTPSSIVERQVENQLEDSGAFVLDTWDVPGIFENR